MPLKEPAISPTPEVLETVLGKAYPAYDELVDTLTTTGFGMTIEWRYYNDGKAWLCKFQFNKKTVCWLSAWNQYFKVAFYFTEKTSAGVFELDIDEEIKNNFRSSKHIGKLIPLVIRVSQKKQLKDALRVIEYKKSCK